MKASDFAEDLGGDCFVRARKRDLERLSTEVMQLREFLPKVINGDFIDVLHKARSLDSLREERQREQLRQECLHFRSRLEAVLTKLQREREEKLVLREQLWECREQLQQQAQFCTGLGAASCTVLWSASCREEAIRDMLADVSQPLKMVTQLTEGKLEPFLTVAGQTLESFIKSLDEEETPQQQNYNSHEHQFVLALAGIITNVAAVTCGRDFISSSALILLDTLMQLLGLMKQGVFPKLKVLMLMALYNVSISVKGLTYISESPTLSPLICTLLEDQDSEVCLQTLRLLQSLLVEGDVAMRLRPLLQHSLPLGRVRQLASSRHPTLSRTAQETLEDLGCLASAEKDQ
ncbi:heat shock factor 2-binding protein isoform X2 [Electrophorus electricus]|uniref:heat shock factor 2-binding protein isoform X2 n=1 Tax=Electrophorus electricus TaxID=8005 RepID=UPI000F0A3919|nr:heat shock factor 2-binding protein isoform X2 [Electrophorus electricus]